MQYWKLRNFSATKKEESVEWKVRRYGPGRVAQTWRKTGVIMNGDPLRVPDVIREWDVAFSVQVGRIRRDTDVITGIDERVIVRDKFRPIIEDTAPGQTQFLPVSIMVGNRQIQKERFWVWHWPIVIDCIDLKCNESVYYPEQKKHSIRGKWTIDARCIPEGLHIFSPKHVEYVAVVSDTLKRALQKIGNGFWFDRLTSVEGPSFKGKTPLLGNVLPKEMPQFGPATPKLCIESPPPKPKTSASAVEVVRWLVATGKAKAQGPASKRDISEISQNLGIELPKAYAECIAEFGAVSIGSEDLLGAPGGDRRGGTIAATVQARSQQGVDWPLFMLCVAEDGMGGWVCLDTSRMDETECPVVYYDHERCRFSPKSGRLVPQFRALSPTISAWVRRAMNGRTLVPE